MCITSLSLSAGPSRRPGPPARPARQARAPPGRPAGCLSRAACVKRGRAVCVLAGAVRGSVGVGVAGWGGEGWGGVERSGRTRGTRTKVVVRFPWGPYPSCWAPVLVPKCCCAKVLCAKSAHSKKGEEQNRRGYAVVIFVWTCRLTGSPLALVIETIPPVAT